MGKKNFGILASISWNSNKWSDEATEEDLAHSNYEYVQENGWMHEDLNFAHKKLPSEPNGTFIAYTPMFNRLPSLEESKYVDIVFFRSLNYHTKQNFIVGFYAYPNIGIFERQADHDLYETYDWGNVASKPEHIVLWDNPVEISDDIAAKGNYLPKGKKLGQQGFNYLWHENVTRILDQATNLNLGEAITKKIKFSFLTNPKYK